MERRAFMLFHFVGLALFTQTFASNLNEGMVINWQKIFR